MPGTPVYGEDVIAALRKCWAVLGAPAGKRLAPMLPELVAGCVRRGAGLDDEAAAGCVGMSAATIDRRLAAERAKMLLRGR